MMVWIGYTVTADSQFSEPECVHAHVETAKATMDTLHGGDLFSEWVPVSPNRWVRRLSEAGPYVLLKQMRVW